jgi:hypothetical protein
MNVIKRYAPGLSLNRRRFLKTVGQGLGAAALSSRAYAQVQAPTNVRVVQGVLQPTDFRYLGCMRMPAGVDTQFSYGGLTGRKVGDQLRLFLFGRNTSGARGTVSVGLTASSILLNSGQGGSFLPGDKVVVVRAANANNVPESRQIASVSGDQLTLTTGLAGVPAAGDVVYREQDYFVYELGDPGSYSTDYLNSPRMSLVTAWPDIYNGRRVTWRDGRLTAPMQYLIPAGLYWHESNQLLYWGYYDAYNGSTNYPDWSMGATRLDDPSTGATTSFGPWRTLAVDGDGTKWYGPARGASMIAGPDGSMGGFGAGYGALEDPWGPQFYAGAPWPTAATPGGQSAPDIVFRDRYLEHYYMGGSGPNGFNSDGSVRGAIRSFRYPSTPSRPYLYEGIDSPVQNANPAMTGGICTWTILNGLGGAIWLELTNKHGVVFANSIIGSADTNAAHVTAAHLWYQNNGVGHATCTHGFGFPDTPAITGPVSTAGFPAFIIYDPVDLRAVKAGTKVDYSVNPTSWVDLQSTYGIRTPPMTEVGCGRNIRGFYFDGSRNYLFVLSAQADNSVPGVNAALIHVFAITD